MQAVSGFRTASTKEPDLFCELKQAARSRADREKVSLLPADRRDAGQRKRRCRCDYKQERGRPKDKDVGGNDERDEKEEEKYESSGELVKGDPLGARTSLR